MNRERSDSFWYGVGYKTGENEAFDRVLDIIDKVGNRAEAGDMDAYEVYTEIRQVVLALKGGEQE